MKTKHIQLIGAVCSMEASLLRVNMVAKGEERSLEYAFHPRSIAVVGASAEPGKQGHLYLELLRDFGFSGKTYAVNPKLKEIIVS